MILDQVSVLRVLTASAVAPDLFGAGAAGEDGFDRVHCVDFDRRLSARDRVSSLGQRLLRMQSGPLGRFVARAVARRMGSGARLRRLLGKDLPEIVHCLSGVGAVSLIDAWEQGAPRTPLVLSLTGGDLGRLSTSPWWSPRLKRACSEASAVIVESNEARIELHRHGVPMQKTIRIRAPIDVGSIRPSGPRSRERAAADPSLRVLGIGPLVERQGLAFILEAVALLAQRPPGVHLDIVGSGPLLRHARAFVHHLGVDSSVEIHPQFESQERLLDRLAGADVFVSSSITAADGDRESGPPPAMLLALAAAVPVVATHHGGIPEVVEDGRTGFLARERDVESLASALDRVRDSGDFAREVGLAGRARVERDHDVRSIREETERVYLSTTRS